MKSHPQHVDRAVINLDEHRAIVLFDYLSEKLADNQGSEQAADFAVLDFILGQLEKQLVAPFRDDYGDLLSDARKRLTPAAID